MQNKRWDKPDKNSRKGYQGRQLTNRFNNSSQAPQRSTVNLKLMTETGHGITQHGTHKRQKRTHGPHSTDQPRTCGINERILNKVQSPKNIRL